MLAQQDGCQGRPNLTSVCGFSQQLHCTELEGKGAHIG